MVGKFLISIPHTICPKDFGFKFKEVDIKFKQLKKLKTRAFAKDNNNIKALKRPVTLLRDNYTGKIIDIVKDGKVCQLLKEQELYKIYYRMRGLIYHYL